MTDIMDEKDKEILSLLSSNAKLTVNQLSKKTNIPATTIHNRIKRLEQAGVIRGYSVIVDQTKTGKPISAFVLITITYDHSQTRKFFQQGVVKKIRGMENVESTAIVTGGTDVVVKVNLENIGALNYFITEKLRNIEGIDKTQTLVILKEF